MVWLDARLPIRFGPLDSRRPDEAVLSDGTNAAARAMSFVPGEAEHAADCACCTPRGAAAIALAALFRDRAVASGPAFRGVLATVSPAGEAAIRAALETDPLVSARFRL